MAIFISHKVDFKVKVTVKQYKYILMIKGNIHKIFYRHRKLSCINNIILKYAKHWVFSGDAVAKTLHFQCRGPRFDLWPGN